MRTGQLWFLVEVWQVMSDVSCGAACEAHVCVLIARSGSQRTSKTSWPIILLRIVAYVLEAHQEFFTEETMPCLMRYRSSDEALLPTAHTRPFKGAGFGD